MLLVATCTGGSSGGGSATPATRQPVALAKGEPMKLNVLVYNIEYGGDETTDRVIKKLHADVVGVLESYNRLPEIAKKTEYPYYNVGLQILSKYPIHEPSGADGLYSFIEVQPGYVVAFFNTHLDYVKYGPRLLSEGMPIDEVVTSENEVRASSMKILTPDMQKLAEQGYPVFLTGDFNEPSSLDYAEETIGTRPGITEPVPWPVSETLFGIGLRDTFREIHPDPIEDPGNTWGKPDELKSGAGDRIDYVYAGGPSTTVSSELIGAPGDPYVDRGFSPWTSDHHAVLSSFEVTPLELPTTVSLERRMLTEGDKLRVYYNAPGNDEVSIVVVPEDGDVSDAIETVAIGGAAAETAAAGGATAGLSGVTSLDTRALDPAGYDIIMLDADGTELARNPFWVRSLKADVVIQTSKDTYEVGEPIDVTWDDGPANRWDWIGVYRASASNPQKDDYLLWGYTGGHESGALPPQVFGQMTLDEKSQGGPWPLPPGRYRIHYLLTDKYASAGYVDIRVVE